MYLNHLTNLPLRTDARGRIRFTHNGTRFDIGKSGNISTYRRDRNGELFRWVGLNGIEMNNPALMRTLVDAVTMQTQNQAVTA